MTEEKDELPVEQWVCAGLRVDNKGKKITAWLEPGGQIFYFTEKRAYAIGCLYDCAVIRDGDSVTRRKPVYVRHAKEDEVPESKVNEWRVAELEAEQRLAREARERKAKNHDPLDDAMLRLNQYALACRTTAQRDALIADVIRRLNVAWLRGI